MTFDLILSLFAYVAITTIVLACLWPYRCGSPIFWYPIFLGLISTGILIQIRFDHPSDVAHILANFLALIAFSLVSISYAMSRNLSRKLAVFKRRSLEDDAPAVKMMVVFIFLLSCAATIIYYTRSGANMIILALTSGIQDDYSTMRLGMYAGDIYAGAGYFNQFKNFLLPLTSALVAYYLYCRNALVGKIATVFLIVLCLLAVAGTGQRTYLVFSSLATLVGFALIRLGSKSILGVRTIVGIVLVFVVFAMMTALYKGTEHTFVDSAVLSLERIFYSQQWAGLVAFQMIYERPIVWFAEWRDSLMGLLPGHRGSILANEIHDYMFQSFRGTSPPTLVGSAYHNGGMWLVGVFFALLGIIYAALYERFLDGIKSPARCLAYGALFFYLMTFFVGPIRYPLDNGVGAFGLFLILRKIRFRLLVGRKSV